MTIWSLLLLVVTSNGAPIVGNIVFKQRYIWPLDFGLKMGDGHRIFGGHKTFRGIILAVLCTTSFAWLLGLGLSTGAAIALAAMTGDLTASFIKRRLGIIPGGMFIGLDQIPEALFPLAVIGPTYGLSWTLIIILSLIFLIFELVTSQLLYRLHLRNHPY